MTEYLESGIQGHPVESAVEHVNNCKKCQSHSDVYRKLDHAISVLDEKYPAVPLAREIWLRTIEDTYGGGAADALLYFQNNGRLPDAGWKRAKTTGRVK
jgi:hypothetical protein